MPERRTTEPGLNAKLAQILREQFGLDAHDEADAGLRGKRIDIMITVPGTAGGDVRIGIEMEKYGTNKKAEAVKDAASRLYPRPLVDLAIAGIYPKECKKRDDLTPDTLIEYLHVAQKEIDRNTRDGKHDHRSHSKHAFWRTMAVKDMSVYVCNLHKRAGDPEAFAEELAKNLDAAVSGLKLTDMKNLAKSLTFNYEGDHKNESVKTDRAKNGAKRALLVVAGAALFHTQLGHLEDHKPKNHKGAWPPLSLDQCRSSKRVRQDLIEAWRLILRVDYTPIFASAITVLEACSGPMFKAGIASMASWASETADSMGGFRHDVLGRIFHRVLDTAKQDGSFYTSTAAASLLAGLAIPKGQGLDGYKMIDPCCGTGTLLMSASERLRETAGAGGGGI